MAASYSVYLCDPLGVRLADASSFVRLQYSRVVNDTSTCKLWLPATFDTSMIRIPDGRVEVWRRLPGSSREYLDGESIWLIKALEWDRDNDGNVTILVEADHPLCILRDPGRVIIPSTAGDFGGTDIPDDLIKTIMEHNLGATIKPYNPSADLSGYLPIAPNLSAAGAVITKQFGWRAILPVLQEIAQTAAQQNSIYLAFDIVAPTPNTLEFRTYTQQRGVDHRFPSGANPILFGGAFGNVGRSSLRLDYRKEITAATAGGAGQGSSRSIYTALDTTRIGASPFGYRNTFVNDSQETTQAGLTASANAAIRNGRPRLIYQGQILDAPGTRYGVHWGFGDFVTVQDFGQQFDCRVDAVTVTVDKNRENIQAVVRNDI